MPCTRACAKLPPVGIYNLCAHFFLSTGEPQIRKRMPESYRGRDPELSFGTPLVGRGAALVGWIVACLTAVSGVAHVCVLSFVFICVLGASFRFVSLVLQGSLLSVSSALKEWGGFVLR